MILDRAVMFCDHDCFFFLIIFFFSFFPPAMSLVSSEEDMTLAIANYPRAIIIARILKTSLDHTPNYCDQ